MDFREIKFSGHWMQLQDAEITEQGKYLLMPPLISYLPLIEWTRNNDYTVLVDDPWEYGMAWRSEGLPQNVSTARLWSLELETDEFPMGITKFFTEVVSDRDLPQLHEPDEDVPWDKVASIEVSYKLTHSSGDTEIVDTRPDLFIFEDGTGHFHTFFQEGTTDITVYPLLDGAIEALVRPRTDSKGSIDDLYDSEWFQDYRLTELRIHAALASGRVDEATRKAAYHFGISDARLHRGKE